MVMSVPKLARLADYQGPDRMDLWARALVDQLNDFLGRFKDESEARDRASQEPYQVAGYTTANRSLDVSAATLAQVREVLGTLLYDQGKRRILRVSLT